MPVSGTPPALAVSTSELRGSMLFATGLSSSNTEDFTRVSRIAFGAQSPGVLRIATVFDFATGGAPAATAPSTGAGGFGRTTGRGRGLGGGAASVPTPALS
jgi:hypothetical protein